MLNKSSKHASKQAPRETLAQSFFRRQEGPSPRRGAGATGLFSSPPPPHSRNDGVLTHSLTD